MVGANDNQAVRDDALRRLLLFGPVTARAMFGGYGLYMDGVMFALVARAALYFKVDEENRPDYDALGARPFSYDGRRGPIEMSYQEVPETIFADAQALSVWAGKALAAARRARSASRPRRRRTA